MEFPYLNGDGFLKSRYLFITVPTTLPIRTAYQGRSFIPLWIEFIGQVPSGIPLDLLTQMVFLDIGKWDLLYGCKTLPS
jgi:hypothetical protein